MLLDQKKLLLSQNIDVDGLEISDYCSEQVGRWIKVVFGPKFTSRDAIPERAYRLFEEVCGLMQTCNIPPETLVRQISYTYAKDRNSNMADELSDVNITLLGFYAVAKLSPSEDFANKLARCWNLDFDTIRQKHNKKLVKQFETDL